jgi:hypothetical protein
MTYGLLGNALGWHDRQVPPWLAHPEQTVIEVSAGPMVQAATPEAAAEIARKLEARAPKPGTLQMRIVGPDANGKTIAFTFSLANDPAVGGRP